MSSPVNEDIDKRYMYAPPWARETPQQSPQAIVAAVERLRLERQRAAAAAVGDEAAAETGDGECARNQRELPLDAGDHIEAAMADAVRAAKWTPRSLDPVTMPEPPKPRMDGPTWGMVARLGGAVGAAAMVALVVTGAVPLPSIDISLSSSESANAGAAVAPALDMRDTRAAGQAGPIVVVDAFTPPSAAPAAAAKANAAPQGGMPSEVLTAYASLDTQPSVSSLKSRSESQPSVAPQPKLPELRSIDRDELAGLIKRGQTLLAEGDIASARLLLRRAAEAGDANAALMLAGTYDRAELARLKVIGVAPDHAQAKLWYTKAVEHGSAEAVRRLQQLAQRAD